MEQQRCTRCNIVKPINEFYRVFDERRRKNKWYYQRRCKDCIALLKKEWASNNPEHVYRYDKQFRKENPADKLAHRLRRYGISKDMFFDMLAEQEDKCYICQQYFSEIRKVFIDHDYDTNIVRRLLCNRCNTGLGYFLDRPDLLHKAADYIAQYKKVEVVQK